MPIIASANSGAKREPVPAGNYIARCYSIIHIGTTVEVINGQSKPLNKVRVTWELPDELRIFNEEKGYQPCVVSEEYTLSLSEKANLRKMLESWRGRPFTEDEAKGFDITNLMGVPCMVNVINKVSKSSGNVYEVVSAVTGLPKGVKCPPQVNDSVVWSYDNPDMDIFNNLPEFIQEKIRASDEWKALQAKGLAPKEQSSIPNAKVVLRSSGPMWDAVVKQVKAKAITIDEVADRYDMDGNTRELLQREYNRVNSEPPPLDPIFEVANDVSLTIEDDLPF